MSAAIPGGMGRRNPQESLRSSWGLENIMNITWHGIYPASTTQFNADQSLNIPATMQHVEKMSAAGMDGIIMLGSVGENTTLEYAEKLAAGPSVAIGHAKLAITQGFGAPLDLGLAIEREAISRVFVSEDAEEGIKAFGEKRKADFKGL